ncbi:MAG: DUF6101 family protein [Beijerinckiaceae bacterium]
MGNSKVDRRGPVGAAAELTCDCARAEGGVQHVKVSSAWVCLERRLAGMETVVNVPTASYRGVALRAEAGRSQFEIVLLHMDPSLEVVLMRAGDDAEIIARWRGFGSMLDLPLLVEDEAGRLQPLEDDCEPRFFDRRSGSALKERRPRFLARRQVGKAERQPIHSGERELFASAS